MIRLVALVSLCAYAQCALRLAADRSYADEIRLNRKTLAELSQFTSFVTPSVDDLATQTELLNRKYLNFFTKNILEKLYTVRSSNDSNYYEQAYEGTFDYLLESLNNDNLLNHVVHRAYETVKNLGFAFEKLYFYEKEYCGGGVHHETCEHQLHEAFRAETAECQYFQNVLKLSDLTAKFSKAFHHFLPQLEQSVHENRVLYLLHTSKRHFKKLLLKASDLHDHYTTNELACPDVRGGRHHG